MCQREFTEGGTTRGSQAYPDFATVFGPFIASNEAGLFEAARQFEGTVWLDEHAGRQFANSRLCGFRETVDGEEELMLLRLDAVLPGGGFAEEEEAADLATEFGEIAVLAGGEVVRHYLDRITM